MVSIPQRILQAVQERLVQEADERHDQPERPRQLAIELRVGGEGGRILLRGQELASAQQVGGGMIRGKPWGTRCRTWPSSAPKVRRNAAALTIARSRR